MVRLYHLERVSFRDGVNEEEALAVEHVVLPHRTVGMRGPTIVKEKGGGGEDRCHKIGPDRRTKREWVIKSVSAPRNLTITNQKKKDDDGEGTLDMPKLFLASCVQHVHEGLHPVDKTFLPV